MLFTLWIQKPKHTQVLQPLTRAITRIAVEKGPTKNRQCVQEIGQKAIEVFKIKGVCYLQAF
jgi:hypothetical protein